MATNPTSKAQQQQVSAGLALGLCMLERYSIPSGKQKVEFSFRRAWRDWDHSPLYPAMNRVVDLSQPTVDPYYALLSAGDNIRRLALPYYWDRNGRTLTIYGRDGSDWDIDDPDDIDWVAQQLHDSEPPPAAAWRDLAAAFLSELDR